MFFLVFFFNENVCQSAIFNHIVKQNDVLMYAIICCLCAKYEYNRSIRGRDMVLDARTHGHENRDQIHKPPIRTKSIGG